MTETRLTPHFLLEEFTLSSKALSMGVKNTPTQEHLQNIQALAEQMEKVRALFDQRIEITSGYRNPVVNAAVGGVPNSAHALGHAADFHVAEQTDLNAAKRIRDSGLKWDQLIYEKNRCVHISFAPAMRQMVMRQPGGPGSPVHKGLEPSGK
ncbi:D-Ala-D-Ala carboxypeptidase family metallohydrolase [Amaricoccus sp.]|uniref:D-Ala-D-Ala carboxypeptidase family metallohydrolase n=1 Tax=Amaricoccus sp. TaxID=1872485 RepID=UPI001B4D8A3C|nr:D-Ala-D-Ala carboxypeptidase family metallohydrolase [Amaricoccus sp.]MBP7241981.1 hypothetical protein [Amaricoccus sp.]